MTALNLGGFDVVIHLAEDVINHGLNLLPSGTTFPIRRRGNVTLTALHVPLPGLGGGFRDIPLVYDAFVEFFNPQVTLDQSTGHVKVTLQISTDSELSFLHTLNSADAAVLTGIIPQIPVQGTIQLDCPFAVANISAVWGGMPVAGRSAVARAAGVSGTITLSSPTGDVQVATPLVGSTAVTIASSAITTALQSAFGDIGSTIGDLPLTNPVRIGSGARPPQIVRDVQAAISPTGSPRGISLGVLTGITPASPGGTIPAPPAPLSTLGAVVWTSNYWMLQLVASGMSAAHPGLSFTFDPTAPSASFSGSGVTIPGGDSPITITSMTINVNPGIGLHVHGAATASGGCWTADIGFDFDISFSCDPSTGGVVAGVANTAVTVDTHKDWLCILVGVIVGVIGGFIVGAIIGAIAGGPVGALIGGIIGAVAGGIIGGLVADGLIDPLSLTGVSLDSLSVLGGLTLPLPVGAAGFLIDACNFDDLAVSGGLVYVDFAPRHGSGTVTFAIGDGFDLDSGSVRPAVIHAVDDAADLVWDGVYLRTLPGSVIGPYLSPGSNPFETLSLAQIEGYTYSRTSAAVSSAWTPLVVRTDAGRYAKCRARREASGQVSLEYVVYEVPPLCLGSLATIETLSEKVVDSGNETCMVTQDDSPTRPPIAALITAVHTIAVTRKGTTGLPVGTQRATCGTHTTTEFRDEPFELVDREQRITVEALPEGLAVPIRYRWVVFGTSLSGTGTTTVRGAEVSYDENSPVLTLHAPAGVDLIGSITIIAIDRDCRKLAATRYLNSPSRIRHGGCCRGEVRAPSKLTMEDAAAVLANARIAERVYSAGVARLATVASFGRVIDVQPVSLADAVAKVSRR
jgi:hypothetical protein